MKVFVYFNLHKKLFSVRAMEGPEKGRVIAHKEFLTLTNATPRVSEKGRQRVLQERRKNVHAGIVGEWPTRDEWDTSSPYYVDDINHLRNGTGVEGIEDDSFVALNRIYIGSVSYNPYIHENFVCCGDDWKGSPYVVMSADTLKGVYAYE